MKNVYPKIVYGTGIISWCIFFINTLYILTIWKMPHVDGVLSAILAGIYIIMMLLGVATIFLPLLGVIFAIIFKKTQKITTKQLVISLILNISYGLAYIITIYLLSIVGAGV